MRLVIIWGAKEREADASIVVKRTALAGGASLAVQYAMLQMIQGSVRKSGGDSERAGKRPDRLVEDGSMGFGEPVLLTLSSRHAFRHGPAPKGFGQVIRTLAPPPRHLPRSRPDPVPAFNVGSGSGRGSGGLSFAVSAGRSAPAAEGWAAR